ncbi:MAG: DUF427 domain-containing protein [Chloroflexi bacterium]|nr:DUF427 domain-containing protein [Chloroflexota bacterium]
MGKIAIRKAEGKWCVRAGGAILVDSKNALTLSEDGLADVIYFPREDVAMAFLDVSERRTHCPLKGDATYFSIVTKSGTLENAAWSYEEPIEAAERIRDHIAFHAGETIAVERI